MRVTQTCSWNSKTLSSDVSFATICDWRSQIVLFKLLFSCHCLDLRSLIVLLKQSEAFCHSCVPLWSVRPPQSKLRREGHSGEMLTRLGSVSLAGFAPTGSQVAGQAGDRTP